jgi:conjugal transfer pilus assembly protein TraD
MSAPRRPRSLNTTPPPRRPGPRYLPILALFALMALAPGLRLALLVATVLGAAGLAAADGARRRRTVAVAEDPRSAMVLLGHDPRGEPVTLSDRQLSAHGLILGASGAGKSTTLLSILTANIRRGRPVIAIDLKGSPAFARTLADAAAATGRPFRVFSPDGPAHWNPLAHGNATELKDKLIATERFTEPHYQRAAERYVQTALRVLMELHSERPPSLGEVVEAMEPARLEALVRAAPTALADPVQDYLKTLTRDQLSAVRGLGTRLAIISESHVGAYLEPGRGAMVDVREGLDGRAVVLFSLNSSRYGSLSAQLGTIAVQDLVAAVGDRLQRPGAPDAVVGIDEFSALGADHVVNLLARGREAGVSVIVATQELADLDRAARGLRDQVLGNTAFKIAHRQDVPSSAAMIAELVGTEQVWDRTYRAGCGLRDSGRGTERLKEQPLLHPNEVKRLRTGEGIMITKTPDAQARRVHVTPPPHQDRGGAER